MQTVQLHCLAVACKKDPRFLWVYQFLKTKIRHKISQQCGMCDQQRQTDLSLCPWHIPHCWKSHVTAGLLLFLAN